MNFNVNLAPQDSFYSTPLHPRLLSWENFEYAKRTLQMSLLIFAGVQTLFVSLTFVTLNRIISLQGKNYHVHSKRKPPEEHTNSHFLLPVSNNT